MLSLLYFGLLFATYLGLFAGLWLAKIAEEELKEGVKFFKWLKPTLFLLALIIIAVVFHDVFNTIAVVLLLLLFALILLLRWHQDNFIYGLFAVILFLSFPNTLALSFNGVIIFFYGLVQSSSLSKRTFNHVIANHWLFLVVGLLLGLF